MRVNLVTFRNISRKFYIIISDCNYAAYIGDINNISDYKNQYEIDVEEKFLATNLLLFALRERANFL